MKVSFAGEFAQGAMSKKQSIPRPPLAFGPSMFCKGPEPNPDNPGLLLYNRERPFGDKMASPADRDLGPVSRRVRKVFISGKP